MGSIDFSRTLALTLAAATVAGALGFGPQAAFARAGAGHGVAPGATGSASSASGAGGVGQLTTAQDRSAADSPPRHPVRLVIFGTRRQDPCWKATTIYDGAGDRLGAIARQECYPN